MSFDSLLNTSAILQTKASSQNSLGEWLITYTNASAGFNCRMSPISAMEIMVPEGRYDDIKYRCFCASSTQISVDNRVLFNGKVYRVREVILDSSYHHKSSLLSEL